LQTGHGAAGTVEGTQKYLL